MINIKKTGVLISVLISLLLLVSLASSTVSAESYVVVNSRDWHDLYLGTVYAGLTGQSIISFANLGEAQTKSKLIAPDSQVTILEPAKNPVVKKYASYLLANGVSKTNTLGYDNYVDLQFQLANLLEITPNQPLNGYAVLYSQFGVEAVAIVPTLYAKNYMPLFVDENVADSFFTGLQSVRSRPTILAGHLPVRLVTDLSSELSVVQKYTGQVEENTAQIVSDITQSTTSTMGVITRIDRIDLQSLKRGLPQFVYAGSAQDVATQIANSNLVVFEVISSDAADLAKSISALSGRNLKLLVKYARGFTNIQGLSGQLLDLDTVEFPYPYTYVTVEKAIYFEKENTLAITLKNDGTIPSYVYSTIEFGQSTYADDLALLVPPKTSITFPYALDSESITSSNRVVINTLYGRTQPLTQSVLGPNGEPLVVIDAKRDATTTDDSSISFVASRIDETNGVLQIDLQNNRQKNVVVQTQVALDNVTLVSAVPTQLRADQLGQINIPIPYLSANDILEKQLSLTFSYGEADTIKTQHLTFAVTEVIYPQKSSSLVWIIVAIVILLLLILIVIIIARKNRTHNGDI